jgi:hypothetical protein
MRHGGNPKNRGDPGADVVGYSRLAGADEDRTLSRLRGLRSDLIDPAIDAHHGRIVKRTGDGSLIEFRSVVDAVRCAVEVQTGMIERNAGLPPERRIEFRVGIHLGDVVEESDGDLMGDGGFIFGDGKAYWVYRYRVAGREREMSLGPYPETTLEKARAKHAVARAQVLNKSDPLANRRNANASPASSAKPTFGVMADEFVATHEGGWRNSKHRWQWTQTLTSYCAPIRDKPVDQIGTDDILAVLKPLWTRAPVTGSRLRGRIEKIIDAARALGHIDRDSANPARWRGHLELLLPKPAKLARGHHAAMPYADISAFVQRLRSVQAGNTAALALEFLILTASRSGETLGAQWEEIDFDKGVWTIPPGRMKTNEPFSIPLSDRALTILRTLDLTRGKNPFVFPGRPQRPLSNMALAINVTVHDLVPHVVL